MRATSVSPLADPINLSISGSATGPGSVVSEYDTQQRWGALSKRSFVLVWLVTVSLHLLCAVVLILMGRVYAFVQIPRMVYWAKLVSGSADNPFFTISGTAFTVVGSIHCLQVAAMLWFSLRARELVFRPAGRRRGTKISTVESLHLQLKKSLVSNRFRFLRCLIRVLDKAIVWVWKKISNQGLVSDESKLLFKILAQSYQVYRTNHLLSRLWINSIAVSLLILNCWSPSLLQWLLQEHPPALERFSRLLVDAMLSIASNFVVPFVIFWPYYTEFSFDVYSFPAYLSYDSLWFTRFFLESRMLLALSTLDLVTKLVNQLSIYSSLVLVTALVRRQSTSEQARKGSTNLNSNQPSKRTGCRRIYLPVIYALVALWGVVLVAIYSRAVHRMETHLNGCLSTNMPWFPSNYPCSIFIFNCYRQGVESPVGSDLDALDQGTLTFLIFTHCPALRMPPEIQNFPSLLGLQIHNSSIQAWPQESAVSAIKNSKLIVIVMTRTNMAEFPQGLLGQLPESLADIQLSISNLTVLPADFNANWHSLSIFYLEFARLKQIPASFFQRPVTLGSFVGNQIEYLPPLDDVHTYFFILDLGKNPIQALPAAIGAATYMSYLNVEDSNLSSVPPWVSTNVGRLFFCGSPYCEPQNQVVSTSVNAGCESYDWLGGGRLPVWVIDSFLPL